MFRNWTFAAFATVALASSPALAQGTSEKKSVDDALFAATVAEGGMAELMMAEMGNKKATHPELKKFSEHMVESHSKLNAQLKDLATKQGIALPTTLNAGHQFCYQSLSGLTGEDFDHAYAEAQMIGHLATIAAFKAESEQGQNSEMKAWASKTLPHLEEHLKELKPIVMHHEKHGK